MKLENIKKKFEDFEINVNFEVEDGEIYGLVGRSGSGKSTILKIIQGLVKQDSGLIKFERKNLLSSYVFQDFNLLYNKTVFQNVELPLILKGVKNKKKVEDALTFVGLLDKKDSYISSLSGGQKQRVAIARAIVTEPDLLLCDEVTASLDKIVKDEIIALFKKINKEYNTTILIVTHELDVAKKLCDRVSVIENGNILDTFDVNKEIEKENDQSYLEYVREVLK